MLDFNESDTAPHTNKVMLKVSKWPKNAMILCSYVSEQHSDYESPENSFVLYLKADNTQYYAVCVRSLENLPPSFYSDLPMVKLAIQYLLNANYVLLKTLSDLQPPRIRCYCLLSAEPLFAQHFTVIHTLLGIVFTTKVYHTFLTF
mgnify:CR=1 FL=1